ncbi:MAG: exonuclease domain-containing protein [Acidimicrobiales bacterium]
MALTAITRLPEMLVGFDTETTGLGVRQERAIAYGFAVYHYTRPVATEEFFVVPDRPIGEGARRVHGLDVAALEARRAVADVLTVAEGARRALDRLRQYHEQGAFVVGANLTGFDLAMLRWTVRDVLEAPEDFDPRTLRTIDVIDHELVVRRGEPAGYRRSLTSLCRHYGVSPGGHDAVGDARAAVEVLIAQVVANNAGQIELPLDGPPSPAGGW